jgi:hypothetical protein
METTKPKQVKEATVHGLYTHQARLKDLHDIEGKSWRYIAKNIDPYKGISHATLRRIAMGIAPKEPHICEQLHIVIMMPAPVCGKCGVVHTTKRCTANDKPAARRWVRVMGHAGWEEMR